MPGSRLPPPPAWLGSWTRHPPTVANGTKCRRGKRCRGALGVGRGSGEAVECWRSGTGVGRHPYREEWYHRTHPMTGSSTSAPPQTLEGLPGERLRGDAGAGVGCAPPLPPHLLAGTARVRRPTRPAGDRQRGRVARRRGASPWTAPPGPAAAQQRWGHANGLERAAPPADWLRNTAGPGKVCTWKSNNLEHNVTECPSQFCPFPAHFCNSESRTSVTVQPPSGGH